MYLKTFFKHTLEFMCDEMKYELLCNEFVSCCFRSACSARECIVHVSLCFIYFLSNTEIQHENRLIFQRYKVVRLFNNVKRICVSSRSDIRWLTNQNVWQVFCDPILDENCTPQYHD